MTEKIIFMSDEGGKDMPTHVPEASIKEPLVPTPQKTEQELGQRSAPRGGIFHRRIMEPLRRAPEKVTQTVPEKIPTFTKKDNREQMAEQTAIYCALLQPSGPP